jgi:hypothetical protein
VSDEELIILSIRIMIYTSVSNIFYLNMFIIISYITTRLLLKVSLSTLNNNKMKIISLKLSKLLCRAYIVHDPYHTQCDHSLIRYWSTTMGTLSIQNAGPPHHHHIIIIILSSFIVIIIVDDGQEGNSQLGYRLESTL